MDRGAHFFCTDFQVHSPRDENWSGSKRPISDDERYEHAKRFVQICRERGISAVAVTDHHDVCFVRYYQLAAQDETDISASVNPRRQSPVVFPGMELTLNDPCQAIVLLDADAASDLQHVLLEVLGLVPRHLDTEARGPSVVPLPYDLDELNGRLAKNMALEGKYIILPHVGDAGYKTLLRSGFHDKYKQAPCVGGYIEQDWAGHGKKSILEGKALQWGYKPLGVFQTSDSRTEDRSTLGCRPTWVKMAECTAEALRQACLAKESRIHQEQPSLPRCYISQVEVTDSVFMGRIDIELNAQFNALIGSRGTGKSTILEYLRWAMQDQPIFGDASGQYGDTAHADGVQAKRELIQETLHQCGGVVRVTWNLDDVQHIVKADSGNARLTLSVAHGPERDVTPEEIRKLLPITAYSQKQLSSVSIRTQELQRFVEQPIKEQLTGIENEIRAQRERARASYAKVVRLKDLQRQLSEIQTTCVSIRERATAIEKSLPELTEDIKATLAEHSSRLREAEALRAMVADVRSVRVNLSGFQHQLRALPQPIQIEDSWPQSNTLRKAYEDLNKTIRSMDARLSEMRAEFKANLSSLRAIVAPWRANKKCYETRYEAAQTMSSQHTEKINQLGELHKQEVALEQKAGVLGQAIAGLGDANSEFAETLTLWMDLHGKRADIIERECAALAQKSDGLIEAQLKRGADIEDAISKLRAILQGAHISASNWESFEATLLQGETGVKAWQRLMLDLRPLAETDPDGVADDFVAPRLKEWDLTDRQRNAITRKLTPEGWLDLVLTSLRDIPKFWYKKGTQKIQFEKASAGEQATALLKALLSDEGGPLIIDQPEDDLNKELTQQIVQQLWKTKEKRQVIFASHDANLVVNGDAELIIVCDYASAQDRSRGAIALQGAIDVRDVRDAVTKFMEGGKRAFELRKEKYGF